MADQYADLRDVSGAVAMRLLGMGHARFLAVRDEIPTHFYTEGGQYRVSIGGIKSWQLARSGVTSNQA